VSLPWGFADEDVSGPGINLGTLPYPSPIKVNEQRAVIRAARQRVVDAVTQ
jgi:hypothetical protein